MLDPEAARDALWLGLWITRPVTLSSRHLIIMRSSMLTLLMTLAGCLQDFLLYRFLSSWSLTAILGSPLEPLNRVCGCDSGRLTPSVYGLDFLSMVLWHADAPV